MIHNWIHHWVELQLDYKLLNVLMNAYITLCKLVMGMRVISKEDIREIVISLRIRLTIFGNS